MNKIQEVRAGLDIIDKAFKNSKYKSISLVNNSEATNELLVIVERCKSFSEIEQAKAEKEIIQLLQPVKEILASYKFYFLSCDNACCDDEYLIGCYIELD